MSAIVKEKIQTDKHEELADKISKLTDEEFQEVIRRVRVALNPQYHLQSETDDRQVL